MITRIPRNLAVSVLAILAVVGGVFLASGPLGAYKHHRDCIVHHMDYCNED
jgi:hypothetical protein